MDEQSVQVLIEIAAKTAKIETQLESQRETLERIEASIAPLKRDVHQHGMVIKAATWFVGIIVSLFTAKYFGKF